MSPTRRSGERSQPRLLRPKGGVAALAAHRAQFEQRYCQAEPRRRRGLEYAPGKCALRLWPHLPRFSNQMLRYLRKPADLVHERGLPAHRAGSDAYVTAHHLRDMLNEVSMERLLEWSREPGLLPRVPAADQLGAGRGPISMDLALQAFAAERDIDVRFSDTDRAAPTRRRDLREDRGLLEPERAFLAGQQDLSLVSLEG